MNILILKIFLIIWKLSIIKISFLYPDLCLTWKRIDSENERLIGEAIDDLSKDKTIITIAHHLNRDHSVLSQ